ncbi:MAG: hypothetical protein U0324_03790 [Polyangiales bacterium]
MKTMWCFVRWCVTSIALVACGAEGGAGAPGSPDASSNGAACAAQSDCPRGQACLTAGGRSACAVACSVGGDECSGTATCGPVGSASVNFCRAATAPDDSSAAPPEEPPRAPCRTDAECVAFGAGAVCGASRGARDCTIPCAARADCNPPSRQGVAVNVMDCVADAANPARRICVPDPACFQAGNPFACVSVP